HRRRHYLPIVVLEARQRGFEPLTHGLEGRCSIHLSYWRPTRGGGGRFERPTTCSQGRCATRLRYAPPPPYRGGSLARRTGRPQRRGGQTRAEGTHRACAMAHARLLRRRRDAERASDLVGDEHRIVAEPSVSLRRLRDAPRADPFALDGTAARPREHDHGTEARAPIRDAAERGEELRDPLAIRRGVARRVDARPPAEGIDLETRIVGQRGKARGGGDGVRL